MWDITPDGNVIISCAESRALLARIGIPGEIVQTPDHSDDSVSLLLDDGSVFTGDLPAPHFIVNEEEAAMASASWRLLRVRGARRTYPGHGPVREFDVDLTGS